MKFLASVRFALILLVATALFVIAGTVIESLTDSHGQAARAVYGHPLFLALLVGFFVNILCAALSRWPWRKAHTPFLIAHLGLLMVVAGVMVKGVWGVQGVMRILEGSGSHEIVFPGTRALSIDGRQVALGREMSAGPLQLELLALHPHCHEELELFVKRTSASLAGLPPIPLERRLPVILPDGSEWDLLARHVERFDLPKRCERPTLFLQREPSGDNLVALVGPDGLVHQEHFIYDASLSLLSLDGGRGGYAIATQLGERQLMAPVTRKVTPKPAQAKLESNKPLLVIRAHLDGESETIALPYEGLAWPLFGGKHLLRFEPERMEIPHHLRLRRATQTNYPGTAQAFSYEAELLIADQPVHLAMNRVHQTWDGYRFYLSNLDPTDGSAACEVQLAVNRDPAKYWLTYPGGALVALGTFLLYVRRTRRKR